MNYADVKIILVQVYILCFNSSQLGRYSVGTTQFTFACSRRDGRLELTSGLPNKSNLAFFEGVWPRKFRFGILALLAFLDEFGLEDFCLALMLFFGFILAFLREGTVQLP